MNAAVARGGSARSAANFWRSEGFDDVLDEFTCQADVSTLQQKAGSTKRRVRRGFTPYSTRGSPPLDPDQGQPWTLHASLAMRSNHRLGVIVVGILKQAFYQVHRQAVQLPRANRITETFVQLAGKAESLLDVGAGDGAIAAEVARRVGAQRVAGVDVLVRPVTVIEVISYDGERLPFEDKSFEVVTISDVLHHCAKPQDVLRECLRVASRCVLVKDHFRFGPLSNAMLLALDVVGNAEAGVLVRGTYFSPNEWIEMVRDVGGRIGLLEWPMQIHATPLRYVTRDELQFAMRVEKS